MISPSGPGSDGQPAGTPIDLDKMRSIGVLGKRTKPQVVEGRAHPDSGARFRSVTDELNNTVTEHWTRDDRRDVQLRPETVRQVGNAR